MKKVFLIPLIVVIIGGLIFGGCKAGPAAPKEILVGVPAPLTGVYAGFGQGGIFGMQAAVDDINKQGGVNVAEYGKKLPIKLKIVNTESDPIKAGTLAESLIVSDKVNFLAYGDEPPPMNAAISNIADRYKVPYICTTGPLEPWLEMRGAASGHWQYTWATGLFALGMPAPAGDFRAKAGYSIADTWQGMIDLFGGQTNKKVAVFACDDPDGVGWYGAFPPMLKGWGYEAVGIDKKLGLVPTETTDFSSVINEWKAAKCEIVWGNAIAPFVGTLLKQCSALGFKPKMASIGRGPLFYEDVSAWGGDLPLGVGVEIWWDPSFGDSPGIGGTTPQSLAKRWTDTGKQLNRNIGPGYSIIQVIIDAVERAGSLDSAKVNAALATTDLMTVRHRIKFEGDYHFSRGPIVYGQWQKVDKPWTWECPVIFTKHDFIKATGKPIFPIP